MVNVKHIFGTKSKIAGKTTKGQQKGREKIHACQQIISLLYITYFLRSVQFKYLIRIILHNDERAFAFYIRNIWDKFL